MTMTAELATHGDWVPADPVDVREYVRLTGTASPRPAGLAVVQARRAFTRGQPLPPGGVLLGMQTRPGDGWEPGTATEYRCEFATREDRAGRTLVTFDVELRSPGREGAPARVRLVIRWERG